MDFHREEEVKFSWKLHYIQYTIHTGILRSFNALFVLINSLYCASRHWNERNIESLSYKFRFKYSECLIS